MLPLLTFVPILNTNKTEYVWLFHIWSFLWNSILTQVDFATIIWVDRNFAVLFEVHSTLSVSCILLNSNQIENFDFISTIHWNRDSSKLLQYWLQRSIFPINLGQVMGILHVCISRLMQSYVCMGIFSSMFKVW